MLRCLVILVCALLAAGCSSYRPAAPLPAPATPVRVSFLSPRDLVVRTATGDSIVLAGVRELRGSVVRSRLDVRTDSLRVLVESARGASGAFSGIPRGATVLVPRETFVRVEQRSFDVMKTTKVIALAAGAVVLLGVIGIGMVLGGGY